MRREGTTVIYTDQELKKRIDRGEDRTDWERVLAMSDEEVEANADADEDSQGDWVPVDDALAIAFPNVTKDLDRDVVDWFLAQGPDYPRLVNQALREFIQRRTTKATAAD